MTSLPRCMGLIFVGMALLDGQAFRVPPSVADAKAQGEFSIILDSPPEKAPVAVQWEMRVPPAIAIEKKDILVGKAAEAAGKSLTCALKPGIPSVPGGVRFACILAGGKNTMGQGPIATVHYRGQTDVGGAPVRVAIENILGVSADLKRIDIPKAAAIIQLKAQ